ncbi:hypothetical protein BaRGS_00037226, partial [Batillaria attramentaria]
MCASKDLFISMFWMVVTVFLATLKCVSDSGEQKQHGGQPLQADDRPIRHTPEALVRLRAHTDNK